MRQVNRALRTLSAGNISLVRATSEEDLLKGICSAIVKIGGYCVAWVGYARNDPERTVELMAWSGAPDLSSAKTSWREGEPEQSATGNAIRTGKRQILNQLAASYGSSSPRKLVVAAGGKSVVALPLRSDDSVLGALSIASEEVAGFEDEELSLLEELAGDLAFGLQVLRTRDARAKAEAKLRGSLETTIEAIAATVERRDPYTAGHERRVSVLAVAIGRELSLSEDVIEGLRVGSMIHDLGKIQVPAEILAKPTRLSAIEFELVKAHPQTGYDILKGIDFPWPVAQMVLQHHERLDGSGYPNGLRGDAIILEARVMAVADVVEAMASHRPYRAGLGVDKALTEIESGRGRLYDAAAVDACLHLFREKRFAWN